MLPRAIDNFRLIERQVREGRYPRAKIGIAQFNP